MTGGNQFCPNKDGARNSSWSVQNQHSTVNSDVSLPCRLLNYKDNEEANSEIRLKQKKNKVVKHTPLCRVYYWPSHRPQFRVATAPAHAPGSYQDATILVSSDLGPLWSSIHSLQHRANIYCCLIINRKWSFIAAAQPEYKEYPRSGGNNELCFGAVIDTKFLQRTDVSVIVKLWRESLISDYDSRFQIEEALCQRDNTYRKPGASIHCLHRKVVVLLCNTYANVPMCSNLDGGF